MTAIEGNAGIVASPRESVSQVEREVLQRAFARLDPLALGIGTGVVAGIVLALGTAALLLRGGSLVGMHLKRLGYFLPGYDVSWAGVGIGLVEGAIAGFLAGALIAALWNGYHRVFMTLVFARERGREMRRELQEL